MAALAATPTTSAPLLRLATLISCAHMSWPHPFDAMSIVCLDNAGRRALPHGPLVLPPQSERDRGHQRRRLRGGPAAAARARLAGGVPPGSDEGGGVPRRRRDGGAVPTALSLGERRRG